MFLFIFSHIVLKKFNPIPFIIHLNIRIYLNIWISNKLAILLSNFLPLNKPLDFCKIPIDFYLYSLSSFEPRPLFSKFAPLPHLTIAPIGNRMFLGQRGSFCSICRWRNSHCYCIVWGMLYEDFQTENAIVVDLDVCEHLGPIPWAVVFQNIVFG